MQYLKFLKSEINPHKDEWIIILCVFLFIILRIPSLVEPYWYGDEGIYQVIGKALNSGRMLYEGIWDNKPPILYLIYALFNGEQFLVRFISLITGVFSVITFFFLGKKLFKNKKSIYVSTLLYAFLFGSPVIEGNIANAENFMHLPILLSAITLFYYLDKKKSKYIFLSGLFISIAFMTKIVAAFEFMAFSIFLYLENNPGFSFRRLKDFIKVGKIKSEIIFFTGFISLFILFAVYYFTVGIFPDFMSAVLSENIDYVGYENEFIFPMGILVVKIFILIFGVSYIFIKRKAISKSALFIYLWLIFSLFSTFFSQRPYTHYILMSSIPFSYFIGHILDEKKNRIVKTIAAAVLLIVVYFNFVIYKSVFAYYKNYIQFTLGSKSTENYQAFFDTNTPRDYELARFIEMFSSGGKYDIFLWSDSGQIYALSNTLPPGRYIVAYHITYYNNAVSYMVEQVEKTKPRFIIKTKESPELKKFLPSYVLRYKIRGADIYEREN